MKALYSCRAWLPHRPCFLRRQGVVGCEQKNVFERKISDFPSPWHSPSPASSASPARSGDRTPSETKSWEGLNTSSGAVLLPGNFETCATCRWSTQSIETIASFLRHPPERTLGGAASSTLPQGADSRQSYRVRPGPPANLSPGSNQNSLNSSFDARLSEGTALRPLAGASIGIKVAVETAEGELQRGSTLPPHMAMSTFTWNAFEHRTIIRAKSPAYSTAPTLVLRPASYMHSYL